MKEINLIDNSFDNLRKGTRYNHAPAGKIEGYRYIVKKNLNSK